MKLLNIFGTFIFCLGLASCNTTNDVSPTMEEEQQQLNQMFSQIETLAF